MDEIDGFWVGLREHAGSLSLPRLAEGAGGWEALRAWRVSDWVAVGLGEDRARALRGCRPERTRGVAVTLADARYPGPLRATPRPPPVLCVEGDLEALPGRGVAVVGTRRCTAYGRSVARRLSDVAARSGLVVVSGLARGIDAEAHRGAMASGRTLAVLGHGLGHTAPPSHVRLRAALLERGGALVSAWGDDEPPRTWTFPRRNAWIAGLSEVVVVVEAPERSGALITAREALALGRDVAAVPGAIGSVASRGANLLLAEGAAVLHDVATFVDGLAEGGAPPLDGWLEALFLGASVDEVARRHGRSTAWMLSELTRLELEGRVVRLSGQRYGPGRRSS